MDKEIKALAEQIQALNKQAFILYQPEVDALINAKIKDEKTIQHLVKQ